MTDIKQARGKLVQDIARGQRVNTKADRMWDHVQTDPIISRRDALQHIAAIGAGVGAICLPGTARAATSVSIRDFHAIGDGIADDTLAFKRAVSSGAPDIIVPKGTYRLMNQIVVPSGVSLRGVGKPLILLDVNGFNATSTSQTYAANACAFMFRNNVGGGVYGLKFRPSSYGAELVVMAIAVRAGRETHIKDCEFEGFSKTKIVRVDSSSLCSLQRNYFHNCHLSSTNVSQLTCIDVDDNRIRGGSKNLRITDNLFKYITVSPDFLSKHGNQTDAINISNEMSSGHLISKNWIDTVGEGVDCFGNNCIIEYNYLKNCHNYGVKITHGARKNLVRNNIIIQPGLGGIVLAGSSANATDTEENLIAFNTISEVGAHGQWPKATTFGIKLEDDHGNRTAHNNTIKKNIINKGIRMDYGILVSDNSYGNNIFNNEISGYVKSKYISVDFH